MELLQNFDANKKIDEIVKWIQDWFEENGPKASAVIGISGGKDSTIVAALLVKALGKDFDLSVHNPNKTDTADESSTIQIVKEIDSLNKHANCGQTVGP